MRRFSAEAMLPLLRFVEQANACREIGRAGFYAKFVMGWRYSKVTLEMSSDCKENRLLRQYTFRNGISQCEAHAIVASLCEAVQTNSQYYIDANDLFNKRGGE